MTVVAIDGPAGAGKSTVARHVAEALGFLYVDTGAMYRALAHAALDRGADLEDGGALAEIAASVEIVADGSHVHVDGSDVSQAIRSEEVSAAVSVVAAHPEVRSALIELQRAAAKGTDCVIEGRDIGTVVFPDAEVKIFLTASPSERAARRWEQMGSPTTPSVDDVERAIVDRDRSDSERETSPLTRSEDATVIDTTGMSAEEVVQAITGLVSGDDGHA